MMFRFFHLAAAFLVFLDAKANGYLIDPPTTADPNTVSDCSNWAVVSSTDTCQALADANFISLGDFDSYNPSVGASCKLVVGNSYCVERNWGIPVTTSTTVTTTSTGNGVSTPTPTQTGMTNSCNKFHKVVSGDTCGDLATANGILLATFYAWNPAVGSTCSTLVLDVYVCVGILGSTTTTATTTTVGNGISTPTPTQTGMTSSCNKFHKVVSGDTCGDLATANGISLANFYAWNPAVGTTCSTLVLDVYVCVGIIGSTTVTTTTTTTVGNGISTPTPTQTGMTTSCNKFHKVVSGDTCGDLATANGISLANFYAWNPAVGTTCSTLVLDFYVCVGIIGGTPTTSTTSTTTTTKSGNGVTTPTPTQPNMTKNCSKFHLVKSGDQCGTIASSSGITLAQFYSWNPDVGSTCSTLFLDYYVCIGVLSLKRRLRFA